MPQEELAIEPVPEQPERSRPSINLTQTRAFTREDDAQLLTLSEALALPAPQPPLVTPSQWTRATARSMRGRSSEMDRVDRAYKAYYAKAFHAGSPIRTELRDVSFDLLESLSALVAAKGGDWALVKRNVASGGMLAQWHHWLSGEWGELLAEQQRRERSAVEWEVKRSRFGVVYLLGNTEIEMDWSIAIEGVAAVGGAVALGTVGGLEGVEALTAKTVDLDVTDVSVNTLTSLGKKTVGVVGEIGKNLAKGESTRLPRQSLKPKHDVDWYVPTFPTTCDMFDTIRKTPIEGPGDVVGLIVAAPIGMTLAVGVDLVVETVKTIGKNLWAAVHKFVDYVRNRMFQNDSFAAGIIGSVIKPLIGIAIGEICKAAAPFMGGAVQLATGIARTVDAAIERTALWWNRAKVKLTDGHFALIGDSIEWQVVKGMLYGLWTALKGAADIAMNAFLPGTGSLASVVMAALEWIAKLIFRLVERGRVQKFLEEHAQRLWTTERDLAERSEGPTIPGHVGPSYVYEPSRTPNSRSVVHNRARFVEFFKKGCDASVMLPMITLNSGICGSIYEQIEMLEPNGRISQSEFDAGVRYFTRLRRITGTYLRSCGFRFSGKSPYIKGVLAHAVYDNNALTTGQKIWTALAS